MKKGFTLIEVIIVLVILSILMLASVPVITGYQREVEVQNVAETIVSKLRYAQSKSIVGEGTDTWGLHFDTTDPDQNFVALFHGTSYGAGTDIEPFYLINGARLSNLALQGGGNDIFFQRLSGTTSQYGAGAGNQAVCVTQANNPTACMISIVVTERGKIGIE